VDFDANGTVQITRQSNATAVQLSKSEWIFLLKVADIQGWPVAPPTDVLAAHPELADMNRQCTA
jgi:hypothetical protein